MKLCVIAPKEGYLEQAGVRIRYRRMADHLPAYGHSLELKVIDDLRAPEDLDADAYLFSKVYDARSYVVARQLRLSGKPMGVDLFDDYFSQVGDSRFTPQRRWLRAMAHWSSFVLCSTPRMKSVAASYMPGLPAHILNDPCQKLEVDRIGDTVRRNVERTLERGELQVAWFGNGDNPHFPVGLRDVHAFGPVLGRLASTGLKVRLRLLTNMRALTVDGLEALARLPVPWLMDEWSLAGEEDLLRESLVAFIPVNAQPFSIAKSLNRAVSALSTGAQVLSAGYPLYEPLGEFIYRDPGDLLADLGRGALRLRQETLPRLVECFREWADPDEEARRLARFLDEVRDEAIKPAALPHKDGFLGIVHGLRSGADVHQLAQRHRHFSIGSPFSHDALNYDVRFVGGTPELPASVEIEDRAIARFDPLLRDRLVSAKSRTGRPVFRIEIAPLMPAAAHELDQAAASRRSRLASMAAYDPAMAAVFDVLVRLFPGIEVWLSESDAPFTLPDPQVARVPQQRRSEVAA
jgi:hypothetical protein